MTSIACGGGPTLEQRRAFAGLKDGAQIPGYGGYCPQLKYRIGKTFGQETHELSQERKLFLKAVTYEESTENCGPHHTDITRIPYKLLRHDLPKATGDNKYTREMVPGFTGYIPSMPFRYGATYRELCDQAIDDMMTKQDNHQDKDDELKQATSAFKKMQPISHDPRVRDLLNLYRDTHPLRPILIEDHRSPTEAPIPGYRGYIPRVGVSEVGLGARYHRASKMGLEDFYRSIVTRDEATKRPVDVKQISAGMSREPIIDVNKASVSAFTGRRLYAHDGMIPKYTGFVPHRRFAFGNTYGETTRKMSVCHHEQPTYGEHVRRTHASSAYF